MNSSEGQQFYVNLITSLNNTGIAIIADLYHYDLPERLVDSEESVIKEEYLSFVNMCFDMFGEYVGHWITHAAPLSEVENISYKVKFQSFLLRKAHKEQFDSLT